MPSMKPEILKTVIGTPGIFLLISEFLSKSIHKELLDAQTLAR